MKSDDLMKTTDFNRTWDVQRADKFCSSVTDGTHDSPKPQKDGRKLITSKHLKEHYIDFDSAKWITEEDYQKIIKRSSVDKWDILYSMIGTIGTIYIEKNEKIEYACKNMGIFKFGGDKEKAYWMYYYLKSPQAKCYIYSHLRGSTQSYVPLGTLRELPVLVPPKRIRDNIISILQLIDEKIEKNITINQNLEQQAQAIFDSYYGAASMKCPFTERIQVMGGGTPKTSIQEFWNGEIPFFSPKDLGMPYTFMTEKSITEEGLAHCNSKLFPLNTCFVTARGTVGKVCLAGKPMAMNQSCYALMSDTIDPILVYFYTLKVVSSLKHKASGAVFDAIITRDFETEYIAILDDTDSKKVLELIKPIMDSIHINSVENIQLSFLRDALLPKLMSGELDVSTLDI